MTSAERRRTMEERWASIIRGDSTLESPCWHEGALEETVARYNAGEEEPLDWVEAQRLLRKPADKD